MARDYTADGLIESLKRRAAIPISQQTFTDQDLIDYLNDQMIETIVPIMIDYREEYLVTFKDYPINNNAAAVFKIPDDAIGSRLRDVVIANVKPNGETDLTNLPQLALEQISGRNQTGSNRLGYSGFYIQGDNIHLYPEKGWGNEVLRLYYFKRTPLIVLKARAGLITAVDPVNSRVTVDNISTDWTAGFLLDVVDGQPSFGKRVEAEPLVSISGGDLTFADISTFEIGDYVCDTGESVFPQLPFEFHNLLLQAAKIVILESLNDISNLEIAVKKYDKMESHAMKTVTPRVDGQAKKITSNNNIFNTRSSNWI